MTSTWGERLERQAALLRRRVAHVGMWQASLEPLAERLTARQLRNRFQRIEALPRRTGADPVNSAGDAEAARRVAVPPAVLARLADATGLSPAAVRVYLAGQDQLAPHAAAETARTDIYLRRFADPGSAAEFGLLVHESVHAAAAARPGAGWRRSSPQAVAEEEEHALALERRVRAEAFGGGVLPFGGPLSLDGAAQAGRLAPSAVTRSAPASRPSPAEASLSPPPPPAARPMAAAENRDLAIASAAPAASDPAELRRQVRQDLIAQIRTEFERGA